MAHLCEGSLDIAPSAIRERCSHSRSSNFFRISARTTGRTSAIHRLNTMSKWGSHRYMEDSGMAATLELKPLAGYLADPRPVQPKTPNLQTHRMAVLV